MDSDEYDYGNDNCQKDPPAQLNALFKISNTGCHRSTIELARLPPCSALPIAPLPSISEIPFPRFTNVDSRPTIHARQAGVGDGRWRKTLALIRRIRSEERRVGTDWRNSR